MSWSSGKDAAYALYKLQQAEEYHIHGLFCTLDKGQKRVSMHGIHESLLIVQAKSLNLPLEKLYLPKNLSMDDYGAKMKNELVKMKGQGVHAFAFGDILLEDIKIYREAQLAIVKMDAVFPLWKENTKVLARTMIDSGLKAIVIAINRKVLNDSFIGREFNEEFLNDLPENVDPCGENGEFHTFVYDGPNFQFPIAFERGDVVERSYASDSETEESWDTSFLFQGLSLKK